MSIVAANNLYLGYEKDILLNLDFRLSSRDFIFITGPSGSGKSTLLGSLYGQKLRMKGQLSVCGVSLNGAKAKDITKLRQQIGVVFQDYKLIGELSAKHNIMLPLKVLGFDARTCEKKAQALLSHVGLLHKADRMPRELSGGEQQRIATARAIANNPKLIICDEPTGNLDELSSKTVWNLLLGAREYFNSCVIVATHHIPKNLGIDYRLFVIEKGGFNEVY